MSTQRLTLTTVWADITAALSLVSTQKYSLQNISTSDVTLSEASIEPPALEVDHIVGQRKFIFLLQNSDSFFARSVDKDAVIVVTETD